MDWLNDLLGAVKPQPKRIDSSRQLEEAKRRQAALKTTPQQEKEARAAGFKNHNEYMLWLKQRMANSGYTVAAGKKKTSPSLRTATASHPITIMNQVEAALRKAK